MTEPADIEILRANWGRASTKAFEVKEAMSVAIAAAIEEAKALHDYWQAKGVEKKGLEFACRDILALTTNRAFVSDFASRPLATKGFRRSFLGW